MSKKEQRIEAKKRKAAAFLQLVKEQEKTTDIKCSPKKKTKLEDTSDGCEKPLLDEHTKRAFRERRKAIMERPKVYLTLDALQGEDGPAPLFIQDLQHLVLFALEGNVTSFKPRWCKLLRPYKVTSVVVVVLNGVGQSDYTKYKPAFSRLDALFEMSVMVTAPLQYGSTLDQEMFNLPLSITQLIRSEVPLQFAKEIANTTTSQYSHDLKKIQKRVSDLKEGDAFPRTSLLLSCSQMSAENYPLPLEGLTEKYKDFVFTRNRYEVVTPTSPMFAVDCEMCKTTKENSELTWVSVVNEDLEVIYETLVKPRNIIIDYLTRYSGITKKALEGVTTRLEDVQNHIRSILPPDAILCGQSLNSDLMALKMFHPYVIDTSIIYNLAGLTRIKPSLRKLANVFLGKLIQDNPSGHNPSEDAIATMELVKLKLKQGLAYGDVRMGALHFPVQLPELTNRSSNQPNSELTQEKRPDGPKPAEVPVPQLPRAANSPCPGTEPNEHCVTNMSNSSSSGTEPHGSCDTDTDKCQNSPSDKPTTTGVLMTDVRERIERRKHFFKSKGYNVDISFFTKLKNSKKKATLVDCPEGLDRYKDVDDTLECIPTVSDKTTKSEAKAAMERTEFVWAQLHAYQRLMENGADVTEEEKQCCLKKVDRRMSRILRSAPDNSICLVLMSGQTNERTINSAMCFVRIKAD